MFDFEKLEVYKKAKTFNLSIQKFLITGACDNTSKNQLRRAALSIALNIAEGSGRRTGPDKRNFYVIARGSVFESIAILDILKDEGVLSASIYTDFYNSGEELSKMLYSMIQTYQ